MLTEEVFTRWHAAMVEAREEAKLIACKKSYATAMEETLEAVALASENVKDKLVLRRADLVDVQPEPQYLYDEGTGTDAQKEEAARRNAAKRWRNSDTRSEPPAAGETSTARLRRAAGEISSHPPTMRGDASEEGVAVKPMMG